ncbi:hypothetical protein [Tissierella sp.]|uniref:hypothetical protein n=1 Tax=Tissierella sp. TaxID=41274 RepID=UPI00285A1478|nr:hypothetical protein [Tissierella sp.]MDR7857829.1 hypothetical protein [Tissierella sp.]
MAHVDEKIVLRFYLEQIKNDNVRFLKGKDTFKNRISEEINLLIKEENMHNKISISKNLWKLLFEAAMSFIDPDKRGYDDIFSYFDEYVNFEELIFASDSFYRDHTMHSLWVYFLGEYIKKNDDYKDIVANEYKQIQEMIAGYDSQFRASKHNVLFKDFLYVSDIVSNLASNEEAIWCVTSLTHDLGYPIKKVGKINKSIQKILPYFHVNNYDEFNFNYTDVQQSYINDFIKFMCYGMDIHFAIDTNEGSEAGKIVDKVFVEEDGKLTINDNELDKLSEMECKKLQQYMNEGVGIAIKVDFTRHLSFSNDFEHYEHGIMSAFLLMKTIYSFSTFKFKYNDYKNIIKDEIDVTKFISMHDILNAITNHTCSRFQIKSISDTSEFLAFIDELEEFSRISRANQSRQYVEEFCKTDLSFVDGWFQVDFIFDNGDLENLDPEFAFKGRCKKFLTLFDIFNLDNNLKIRLRCIDKVLGNNHIYCLEIARKYANIIINGEEQSIPKYLRSNTFYTKEEYAML